MTTPTPRRGDRFILPPPPPQPIRVEVVRVAEDGTWVDLQLHWYGATWRRRRPLPLARDYTPYEWLDSDVVTPDSGTEFTHPDVEPAAPTANTGGE